MVAHAIRGISNVSLFAEIVPGECCASGAKDSCWTQICPHDSSGSKCENSITAPCV